MSLRASLKTTTGLFPPSSRDIWDKFSAEFLTICFAVWTPPVNAILLIFGCEVSNLLQVSAKPVIIFTTPFGIPTLSIIFANSNNGVGAISYDLIIIV